MSAQPVSSADPNEAVPRADELRARRLADYAARALDFDDVQALLERYTATSLGLRAVRELVPLEYKAAKAALARVREAIALAQAGDAPTFGGVSDPLPALAHARKAGRALADDELIALRAFAEAVERLAMWLKEREARARELAALARDLPEFTELLERLDATVDERGRVRDHASPLLWRVRKEEADLSAQLDKLLRAYIARSDLKAVLSDPNPHRRGGRAVLAVKAKSSGRVRGIVHDRSSSGETVFIEPHEAVLLGNQLSECQADERREVERILLELTRAVLDAQPRFERSAERLAQLELAFACARWAREVDARPALVAGDAGVAKGLLLRTARHPILIEQQRAGKLADVVPIDLRLSEDFDVLIITGPNTGGKTLALKTAGLFALMTRAGLPVPAAEGTSVPLYDGIVADIGDEQEIQQSLSTFSSHLKRIKAGLERASEMTLVLLDELGSGTDPDEGAALSEAVLEQFLRKRSPTLVSTHIGKLKEFAFRHPRAENACVEFDARTLAPCYHLIMGSPGESGALVIARRLGLPAVLVDRAQERLVRRDEDVRELMDDMRTARMQAERVRTDAESRLEDAERVKREVERQSEALAQKSEVLEAEAQKSIEDRVREAMKHLEQARTLLPQLPAAQKKSMEELLTEIEGELTGKALGERRAAFLATLKKGSFVYVPRYKQRVPVHKIDHEKREITVKLGAMTLSVPFDEVTSSDAR
jgi:DNA mismatch repair protein MutS2